jgi:uncharacterized membrane protein
LDSNPPQRNGKKGSGRDGQKPYAEMITIFVIAWLLVLLLTILVFRVIVPMQICQCYYDNVAKGVFGLILGVAWLAALVVMRNVMVRRTIMSKEVATTS